MHHGWHEPIFTQLLSLAKALDIAPAASGWRDSCCRARFEYRLSGQRFKRRRESRRKAAIVRQHQWQVECQQPALLVRFGCGDVADLPGTRFDHRWPAWPLWIAHPRTPGLAVVGFEHRAGDTRNEQKDDQHEGGRLRQQQAGVTHYGAWRLGAAVHADERRREQGCRSEQPHAGLCNGVRSFMLVWQWLV